jgi:hypothetical protein
MTDAAPRTATLESMAKQSKKPADLNRLAGAIVGDATDDADAAMHQSEKDPAAVELGRRGGERGGKARAEKMTPEERSEAARQAAQARWRKAR